MLPQQENEILTHVGAGTPLGDLLRQFWIPVVYGEELAADARPYRVRLLGEDLIAFRESGGRVGLLGERCAHRGASLYFGRNEQGGLRCVYHGWRYDVHGRCIDMPNEPEGRGTINRALTKDKIQTTAYPTQEQGGIVWAYMGAASQPPAMPQLEWLLTPPERHRHAWRAIRECNWVQALEGDLDTSHVPFLHGSLAMAMSAQAGTYRNQDLAPRLEIIETEYGAMYGARRDEGDQHYYWRITQYLLPFFTCIPATPDGEIACHMWVPIDDEHTMVWLESWHPLRPFTADERAGFSAQGASATELYWPNNGVGGFKPADPSIPYGACWPVLNQGNDYGLDPEIQKSQTATGIPTVPLQDAAMTASMGRITDRSIEHLGTADAMIIAVRRRLLKSASALREQGTIPSLVQRPELYRVRSGSAILNRCIRWSEAMREWLECRGGLPAEDESARFLAPKNP